jgi:DNA polymerase-3 subunit gamma/tau
LTAGTPHQAIYRRWRAQTFSEIVGQEAVVATLRNAVTTGQVAHAILFTGPRGTGKTSLARILAKALNCENLGANADPCDVCPPCVAIREGRALDLFEVDAASNRGIDAVRDLRERLNYAPTDLRRKIYILDEAHQITKDAWNALLKSLEEPPDFVTFMFASTHPQEFPPAILSRLQRFDVRRLSVAEISGKLERILEADGREADPEAIDLVARLAAGGMRDAESILDQLLSSTSDRIEAGAVRELLGLADAELVDRFVAALEQGNAADGIVLLDQLEERGRDLRVFLDQVVDALRGRLLAELTSPGPQEPSLSAAARRIGAIDPTRHGPGGLRFQLELTLLAAPATADVSGPPSGLPAAAARATMPPAPVAIASPTATPLVHPGPSAEAAGASTSVPAPRKTRAPKPADAPGAPPVQPVASSVRPEVSDSPAPPDDATGHAADAKSDAEPAESGAIDPTPDLERLRTGWAGVVADVTERNRAAKPLITACRPIGVEGRMVTLGFPEEQGFLKDVAERRRPLLEASIGGYLGHPVAVRCVATNLDLLPSLPVDDDAAHILAEAHRIFADDLADPPEVT